ncbi:MAG: hypothetical protein IPK96_20440 [Flammeovirgaceae bacterium]|nr:hypothetical protein [Flammeovirgaceae bacterium]
MGVGIVALNVTAVVPPSRIAQPVTGFVANTEIVIFAIIGVVVMLMTPVPATAALKGDGPSKS